MSEYCPGLKNATKQHQEARYSSQGAECTEACTESRLYDRPQVYVPQPDYKPRASDLQVQILLARYITALLRDLKSCFNIAILQMAMVVTVYVVRQAYMKAVPESYKMHVILCTLAYMLLMPSAIIFFSGNNFFGRRLSRRVKGPIHGCVIGLGALFAIIGIAVQIVGKFKTTHAITGLTSFVLIFFTGIASLHIGLGRLCIQPVAWKMFHIFMAEFTYIVGMTSFIYGFNTDWYKKLGKEQLELKNIMIGLASMVTIWTAIPPLIRFINYMGIVRREM